MLATSFIVRSARGRRRDHIWAGAALALLALSRVEFGDVLLACLLLSCIWLLLSRKSLLARRCLMATALALLLCTPWLAYTYSLTGRPFYWGNAGGSALYWMTAPGTLGDWQSQNAVFTNPRLAPDRPAFAEVDRLKPLEQDPRLWHIAVQNIEHHPTHYLSNVVNNIGRLVFDSPYSFTSQTACSMFYAVPNAILLGLLSAATFCAIRMRRRLLPEIIPIAVFAGLGFAIHIPLAASVRYGIPLVPVAVWLLIAIMTTYMRVLTESRPASGAAHPASLVT
jgi:hypothetical protein